MEFYIPTWSECQATTSCSLSGEVIWQLINEARSDRPVIAEGRQSNMLMQAPIDRWLGQTGRSTNNSSMSLAWRGSSPDCCLIDSLAVGSGGEEPANNQIGLTAETARVQVASQQIAPISQNFYTLGTFVENYFVFGPQVANEGITEWGIFSSEGANTGMLCRELFRDSLGNPTVISKTNNQSLIITYRLKLVRNQGVVQNTINMNGTDYVCSAYMNDRQLMCLLGYRSSADVTRLFRSVTSTNANLYVGTSNSPSDVLGDQSNSLKGSILQNAKSTIAPVLSEYVNGSNQRSLTLNIGPDECNGSIGEILMPIDASVSTNNIFGARATFNPPIVKESPQKLAIGFTLSVSI